MTCRHLGQRWNTEWFKCVTLLFLVIFSAGSFAFTIPVNPLGYVHDATGSLPAEVRQNLDSELRDFDKRESTQIVVAIFPSLEGESLEDLSLKLAESWKIGRKGRDNGILFSIFLNDRKMRIEVGYGLEGVVTDHVAQAIIRSVVTPHFRAGHIGEGVVAGARALMSAAKGEFKADPENSQADNAPGIVFLFIFFGTICGLAMVRRKRYLISTHGYGWRSWGNSSSSWGSGGGGFSGGGGSFGGGGSSGSW